MTTRRAFTFIEFCTAIAIIGILAAILFPVFAQARQAAFKANCVSNLSQIGAALQMYARDNDGRFPPRHNDVTPLLDGYTSDAMVFRCEQDPISAGELTDRRSSSYQYRRGFGIEGAPDTHLAGEWEFRHQNQAAVLFLDGSVRVLRPGHWRGIAPGPRPLPPGVGMPPPPPVSPDPVPALGDPNPMAGPPMVPGATGGMGAPPGGP